jgi:hypothetical protein
LFNAGMSTSWWKIRMMQLWMGKPKIQRCHQYGRCTNPVQSPKINAIRRQSVRGVERQTCKKMVLDHFQPKFHNVEEYEANLKSLGTGTVGLCSSWSKRKNMVATSTGGKGFEMQVEFPILLP